MNNEVGATSVARAEGGVLPLEQQPCESDKACASFKTYRELGPERSLAVAADKLRKSRRMMGKWSYKFDWPARVHAHAARLADMLKVDADAEGADGDGEEAGGGCKRKEFGFNWRALAA